MKGMDPLEFYQSKDVPQSLLSKINDAEAAGDLQDKGSLDLLVQYSPEYKSYLESLPSEQNIVQIKGKGNKAPKEEYLPAVQDFVRSGNFGKVGDLGNTGLIDVTQAGPLMKALQDIYGRDLGIGMDKFNAAAEAMPDAQRFMTKDELLKFLGETPPEGFSRGGQVRGYSEGGMVGDANFPTDDFDPDRIDAIVAELHAMNAA
jgi:hypothetical protein